MSAQTRTSWLDAASDSPVIEEHVARLSTFIDALADGKVTAQELAEQEARVVELMKKVEPELSDALHSDVTRLLCELTAFNIMRTMQGMKDFEPKARFRG